MPLGSATGAMTRARTGAPSGGRAAVAALILFLMVVILCLLAPAYAQWTGTAPFKSTLDAVIKLNGQDVPVMGQSTEGLGLGYTPIGPTWQIGNYFLGADNQGRDVMARLLYGGLNSLFIAGMATVVTLFFATLIGLAAGFFGGIIAMPRDEFIKKVDSQAAEKEKEIMTF